ncbi:MAG: transaldolase [Beutenbergiaceae bacterium]
MSSVPDTLTRICNAGVSVWLDDLSRGAIDSGELADLIATRAVVGVTTNPTIFAGALTGAAYADQLAQLGQAGASVEEAVLAMTTDDVRAACEVFTPTFTATGGRDGRVSIEVDPRLAHDSAGTIAAAKQLWRIVDRPNAMIKIPATEAGLPAITAAIAAGISVNVTLIFGLERYRQVANAYVNGLEQAEAAGIDISSIRSVASIFLSRIDTQVDAALDQAGTSSLHGQAAIANARLAYEIYQEVFSTPRFAALGGAHRQRPLWASTGTKNPAYPDTMYVDELVTSDVVNTMPRATLAAVADHSAATGADVVAGTAEQARGVLAQLTALGIDFDQILVDLENAGVASFEASWAQLLDQVGTSLRAAQPEAR